MIIEALVNKVKKDNDLPIQLVCPKMDKVPDDDLLNYISVSKPGDLFKEYKHNDVLMFDDQSLELLGVWNLHQPLFEKAVLVLTDIPGLPYDHEFAEATSRGSKVAYHALIGDLAEAARRSESLTDATHYDKEQRAITKKSGEIASVEEDDFDQSED